MCTFTGTLFLFFFQGRQWRRVYNKWRTWNWRTSRYWV